MSPISRLPLIAIFISSLLLSSAALAQSRTTPRATGRRAARPANVTRKINAEEMQALLKRDGVRPLLVNFWATWCVPCREEFPDLVKIDQQYRPKDLDFIAISLDDVADLKVAIPKFLREMRAQMPNYLLNVSDPEPAIKSVDAAWDGTLPATFLYNEKGEVVYKHLGRIKTDELRAAIEKTIGNKEQKAEGRRH
jgi:thiol-disulfide isomerase/thioredoxin